MLRMSVVFPLVLVLGIAAGCASKRQATSLKPQEFYQPSTRPAAMPAYTMAGNAPVPSVAAAAVTTQPAASLSPDAPPDDPIIAPTTRPALRPATVPTSLSQGKYLTVGTVVAEANGRAIFADKVLAKLDPALRIRAVELAAKSNDPLPLFRAEAATLIERQIMEEINNELEFAAAQRNTGEDEQRIATVVTTQFRTKEITKAGGSLAVVRARYAAEGIDFEERLNEEYQKNLIWIFYARQVWPKVQVTADDMRAFYERYKNELYTDRSEVLFRAITITDESAGGEKDARELIESIHAKARRGDDFAKLASDQNHNRQWLKQGGYLNARTEGGQIVGLPIARGSLKLEQLEALAFRTEVGQVSDILRVDKAFYVVKVEQKTLGSTRPFEDAAVQNDIRERLTRAQRQELRDKEKRKLRDSAVWRIDDKNLLVCLEMAMQKYAMYARGE